MKILDGVRYSMVALQPCPSGHITAGKRLRCASPKLPSAISFIRKMLSEIGAKGLKIGGAENGFTKDSYREFQIN